MRVNLLTKRTRRTLFAIGVMMLSALAWSETSQEVSAQSTITPNGGNCGVFQVNEYCFCTGGYIYCYYPEEPEPDREPLIFVPGIAGSLLDSKSGMKLWIGESSKLTLDPDKPQETVIAPDVVREINLNILGKQLYQQDFYKPLLQMLTEKGGYREYQVNRDPARRTTTGCDLSQNSDDTNKKPNLFVFAYDWRKSNTENAAVLRDYVGCAQKFYPNSKINILAHSMGGLLARRYIIDNPSAHKIERLITIGSPWLGAPKTIYILETGKFFDNYVLDKFFAPTLKSLMEFFPGAHQLLPSRAYFDLSSHSFRPFGEYASKRDYEANRWFDANGNRLLDENYSFEQLSELLDKTQFWRSKPMQTSNFFHDAPGQDDWRGDQTGVLYTQIYGIQSARKTIGKVLAVKKWQFDSQGAVIDVKDYDVRLVNGDGTVPLLSAERIGYRNLAPTVTRIPFAASLPQEDALVEHTGLTHNPKVWDAVLSALKSKPQQVSRKPQRSKLNLMQKVSFGRQQEQIISQDQPTLTEEAEAYYVKLRGVDDILVTDAFGKDTSQPGKIAFHHALQGEVDVAYMGENAAMITLPVEMPDNQTYTATFKSVGQPILIESIKGVGNAPETATQIVRYLDINLPTGTTMMLKFTSQGVEDMRYDADGDGVFEATVKPTASVTGTLVQDIEGPDVTFSEQVRGMKRLVTINTADSGSGVLAVRYSLDGKQFQPYTQPLLVDPAQNPAIYVIADDNVGNRAGRFTYKPLTLTTEVTRDSSTQEIIVIANICNNGDADVLTNFVLKSAKLNTKPTTTPLPMAINAVAAGETATVTLRFSATAAKPNTRATLSGAGTSHGSAFSGGVQVSVP